MFQRPKIGETEEDLLRQEKNFLRHTGKESTLKRKYRSQVNEDGGFKKQGIIGEIAEKDQAVLKKAVNISEGQGFPSLFTIDRTLAKNGSKSLFALHMEKIKNISGRADVTEEHEMEYEEYLNNEKCGPELPELSDVKKSIHEENQEKMSRMSEDEILKIQRDLYKTLDPKLIDLLKSRGKLEKKADEMMTDVKPMQDTEMKDVDCATDEEEIKKKITCYLGEKWLNLDFLEKEKLEWVGDIPDAKCLEPDQPYSARFDFKGDLQPFSSETVDVTKSLHHHGDEPERPGYTIQELYQLSRSTVLQQRILALNTIANVIRKTKLGHYDSCFDGLLLHKLMESDLFLLLRFSIDENALISATINCLRRLLYNDTDEYCLDKLLGVSDNVQPFLFDKIEVNEDEEKELKDNTIVNCDVIKGVLRTDLLVRISYILVKLPCDRETITNAIMCFIRTARHSLESSKDILNKSEFLDFTYNCIKCDKPIYQGVKLFRLLVGQSQEFASQIATKYPMNFVLQILMEESMAQIPKTDFYLLKLEILHLWSNFVDRGFMIDEFVSFTPYFMRFFRFYVEKVDFSGEGDFDFELFSGLVSLFRVCIRKKIDFDVAFVPVMYTCLKKWLIQLMHFKKFNYSGMKALGNNFAFFDEYFQFFSVDRTQLLFVEEINCLILSLIGSTVFEAMGDSLVRCSHLLVSRAVKRDPPNLPSLDSVYEGGQNFLRIVSSQSPIGFFIPFCKYLKRAYCITHNTRNSIESFTRSPHIREYVHKVVKHRKNSDNWFVRYETTLLSDIIQLYRLIQHPDTLKLSFRVLPLLRVNDTNSRAVLSIVTSKESWSCEKDFFNSLYQVYLDSVYIPTENSDRVQGYKSVLVAEDWMYRILTLLRGKEAVAENVKALKFISFILENNAELLDRVPYNMRYYNLCAVFMTDSNVFDDDVQAGMRSNFKCILENRGKVDLDKKVDKNKSFYELYTELITQYAGVSYGLHIFAEFVLFPLQNRFNVSFRKLLWFEYLHVLRVVTLPYPTADFLDVSDFSEPCETDESLLVAYLNSVSNNVIIKNRNPFVYHIAVNNIRNFLLSDQADSKLHSFLTQKISYIKNERIRNDLLN
ncbi:UNVERIFIED_CONTAM: hypothetical protein PYX00_008629 [Menopon gallinae]|uniref:RNA polymerase II-associated protein 1 n=1 Tax=Menopon gallinae TaxID=328185 RepID=A0AAW2HPJ8_9NEOP